MTECICGWPGISYDGPVENCPVHGISAPNEGHCGSCTSGRHDACAGIYVNDGQWDDCLCDCTSYIEGLGL